MITLWCTSRSMAAAVIMASLKILGGHLKTGHTWSLQNRPTERTQNKSIYTLAVSISANLFSGEVKPTGLY